MTEYRPEPVTAPASWPFCLIVVDAHEYPAIVTSWRRFTHASGWEARCGYWRENVLREVWVPAVRVRRVGG